MCQKSTEESGSGSWARQSFGVCCYWIVGPHDFDFGCMTTLLGGWFFGEVCCLHGHEFANLNLVIRLPLVELELWNLKLWVFVLLPRLRLSSYCDQEDRDGYCEYETQIQSSLGTT